MKSKTNYKQSDIIEKLILLLKNLVSQKLSRNKDKIKKEFLKR